MKALYLSAISLFILASCGGGEEETSSTPEANDGVSSIVAEENPDPMDPNYNTDQQTTDKVPENSSLTTLSYPEERHNFGTVFYPSENMYTFKVRNTGDKPLIIERATASCGCTVPNKPEEPIAPGAVGELDVIFRPKKNQVGQKVEKKITVVANTEPKETYLHIEADVIESM